MDGDDAKAWLVLERLCERMSSSIGKLLVSGEWNNGNRFPSIWVEIHGFRPRFRRRAPAAQEPRASHDHRAYSLANTLPQQPAQTLYVGRKRRGKTDEPGEKASHLHVCRASASEGGPQVSCAAFPQSLLTLRGQINRPAKRRSQRQ